MKILAVDSCITFLERIETCVLRHFPDLELICIAKSKDYLWEQIFLFNPDIIIVKFQKLDCNELLPKVNRPNNFEWIIQCTNYKIAAEAFYHDIGGFYTYPIKDGELKKAIAQCIESINYKKKNIENTSVPHDKKLIYIPTVEGAELIKKEDVIRCEGKERCTKIISNNRPVIVSSYNIGFFKTMLLSPLFISVHKSHIVNYLHIRKYLREGILLMSDHSSVPISRRKRGPIVEILKGIELSTDA